MRMNRKMRHRLRRMFILLITILIGYIASIISIQLLKNSGYIIEQAYIVDVVKTMIGIWGSLLGFIISAESILIAFNGGKLTEEIKKTGHFKTILFIYTMTCFELLLLLVLFIPVVIFNIFGFLWLQLLIMGFIISVEDLFLCLLFLALLIRGV